DAIHDPRRLSLSGPPARLDAPPQGCRPPRRQNPGGRMNRSMHPRRAAPSLRIALASLALLLAGCALGPDYERPEVTVPAEFKHMQGWVPAQSMQPMTDDRWWTRYGDPLLQALVAEVDVSN